MNIRSSLLLTPIISTSFTFRCHQNLNFFHLPNLELNSIWNWRKSSSFPHFHRLNYLLLHTYSNKHFPYKKDKSKQSKSQKNLHGQSKSTNHFKSNKRGSLRKEKDAHQKPTPKKEIMSMALNQIKMKLYLQSKKSKEKSPNKSETSSFRSPPKFLFFSRIK